jgi:hypothetical protein
MHVLLCHNVPGVCTGCCVGVLQTKMYSECYEYCRTSTSTTGSTPVLVLCKQYRSTGLSLVLVL